MNITNSPLPGSGSNPNNPSTDTVVRPTNGGADNPEQVSFNAVINTIGVQRTNSFFIRILPPRIILNAFDYRVISLQAESVNLPGVNIGTTTNRRHGYGFQEKHINDATFNDLTVSFINDGDMAMTKIFYDWMNRIVRFNNFIGREPSNGQRPYEFEYKDDYIAGEFAIFVLDERKKTAAQYNIFEAFPISMSDIGMNWGSNDEFARFTVNFSYSFWSVEFNPNRDAT